MLYVVLGLESRVVKIGYSADDNNNCRIRQAATLLKELIAYKTFPGTYEDEQKLHDKYKDLRLFGKEYYVSSKKFDELPGGKLQRFVWRTPLKNTENYYFDNFHGVTRFGEFLREINKTINHKQTYHRSIKDRHFNLDVNNHENLIADPSYSAKNLLDILWRWEQKILETIYSFSTCESSLTCLEKQLETLQTCSSTIKNQLY